MVCTRPLAARLALAPNPGRRLTGSLAVAGLGPPKIAPLPGPGRVHKRHNANPTVLAEVHRSARANDTGITSLGAAAGVVRVALRKKVRLKKVLH